MITWYLIFTSFTEQWKYNDRTVFSTSFDLEAMDQLVEYSLIRTFRLLFPTSLGRLFQENDSRYVELSPQLELSHLSRDSLSYWNATVDLFRRFLSLTNRQNYAHRFASAFSFSYKQAKLWLSCVVNTYLYGAFDCIFLWCHVRVSEWIPTLEAILAKWLNVVYEVSGVVGSRPVAIT